MNHILKKKKTGVSILHEKHLKCSFQPLSDDQ